MPPSAQTILPGEHRRSLVDFRKLCPGGASPLHTVGDIDMKPVLLETEFPSGTPVQRTLPESSGSAASMDHAYRIWHNGMLQSRVLNIHLPGLEISVRIIGYRRPARPEPCLNRSTSLERDLFSSFPARLLRHHCRARRSFQTSASGSIVSIV